MPAAPVTAAPINIIDNDDVYNCVILGGVKSPGKVVLSGHDRVAKWDVKTGPFSLGGTTTLLGVPPIEFTATFSLMRDPSTYYNVGSQNQIDEFGQWANFRRLIESTIQPAPQGTPPNQQQPQPGVLIRALPILHPALQANKISAVTMAMIGGEVYDGKGGMTVAVKFQEYRPRKTFGGTAVVKPKVDPNQDKEDELKGVYDRYKVTAWG
jgi:hypothetical protein